MRGIQPKSSAWWYSNASQMFEETDIDPNVGSPAARRILVAARNAMPPNTIRGPAFDDPGKCPMDIHQYQIWLHARLRSSGLAKGLAGGPDSLPDIADELRWPWNRLAKECAPRNNDQLLRKIVANLEWYVDQTKPVRDPWKFASELFPPCLYMTVVLMVVFYLTTGLNGKEWLLVLGTGLIMFAGVFSVLLMYSANSHKHATNTAELYRYLLEEYEDVEDTKSIANAEDCTSVISKLPPFSHIRD